MQPSHAVHLPNRERQQSAERSRNTGRAEEHGLPQLDLLAPVPIRQIVCHAGEQAGLGHAQDDARAQEASKVPHDAHERHDDAPRHHDGGQPDGRAHSLQHQVAGHLEGGVGEEEGGQAPVVLIVGQAEVFLQTFDLGVADVAA
jgi:hypothetical protein